MSPGGRTMDSGEFALDRFAPHRNGTEAGSGGDGVPSAARPRTPGVPGPIAPAAIAIAMLVALLMVLLLALAAALLPEPAPPELAGGMLLLVRRRDPRSS